MRHSFTTKKIVFALKLLTEAKERDAISFRTGRFYSISYLGDAGMFHSTGGKRMGERGHEW